MPSGFANVSFNALRLSERDAHSVVVGAMWPVLVIVVRVVLLLYLLLVEYRLLGSPSGRVYWYDLSA